MKQIFYSLLLSVLLVSCNQEVKPIEKYYNKGYVVTSMFKWSITRTELVLKNADTIISVTILSFDTKNLKIGDTLK